MAKVNAIGNATGSLTIDPGTSGDSSLLFQIGGVTKFQVRVEDDDDSFRISDGTTDYFTVTDAGERTMPLQPAFLGVMASNEDNVTGAGTLHTVGTTTAFTQIFDQNGDFNTNGTFTAPVAGRYCLIWGLTMEDITAAMTAHKVNIRTSNRLYYPFDADGGNVMDANNRVGASGAIFADMDAADTAKLEITISNGAGDTADVYGTATGTSNVTYFSGYLAV